MSQVVPVWFDGLHVGDVTVAEDGALGFAYTSAWLATQGAFPLSLTLPLRQAPYPSDVISPWLANLLPEEEQLSILTRSLGLDRSDTLAILNEIGGDTAGAFSFGARSERAAWIYTPLTELYREADPEAALERHFDDLQQRPFLAGEEGVRLSLAGGQKKSALAVLDARGTPVLRLPADGDVLAVPRHGAPSTLILKPDNPVLPGIVENETYCLRLAQAVGIPAAEASILPAGKRKAICVLRYDRRLGRAGGLQRIHQEDFAQANGIHAARSGSGNPAAYRPSPAARRCPLIARPDDLQHSCGQYRRPCKKLLPPSACRVRAASRAALRCLHRPALAECRSVFRSEYRWETA
jgi:serine/threonine-protein kinase HipA